MRQRARVPNSAINSFVVHYDGTAVIRRTGKRVPQEIESYHRGKGWTDIGYGFVIDILGNIYEGRGWNVVGAHAGTTEGNNQPSVQLHIGGSQKPTDSQMESLAWLYNMANVRYGKTLTPKGHNDYQPTSCPGPYKKYILDYLRNNKTSKDDIMTEAEITRIVEAAVNRVLWSPVVDPSVNKAAEKSVISSSWRNNLWWLINRITELENKIDDLNRS